MATGGTSQMVRTAVLHFVPHLDKGPYAEQRGTSEIHVYFTEHQLRAQQLRISSVKDVVEQGMTAMLGKAVQGTTIRHSNVHFAVLSIENSTGGLPMQMLLKVDEFRTGDRLLLNCLIFHMGSTSCAGFCSIM